jgi:hypothetical protein
MMRVAKGTRASAPREQIESRFGVILADLVARVPGARAAALVDHQGETVDYAGRLDAFSVRVAAAHMRIILQDLAQHEGLARAPTSIAARTTRGGFAVYALPDGYAVALLLSHKARLTGHTRALSAMASQLADEVGWPAPAGREPHWHAVEVITDSLGRPKGLRVKGELEPLDALGRFESGLGWRQRGWRVRFSSGVEAMLVRELGGFWYADETPMSPTPPEKPSDLRRSRGPSERYAVRGNERSPRKTLTRRPT